MYETYGDLRNLQIRADRCSTVDCTRISRNTKEDSSEIWTHSSTANPNADTKNTAKGGEKACYTTQNELRTRTKCYEVQKHLAKRDEPNGTGLDYVKKKTHTPIAVSTGFRTLTEKRKFRRGTLARITRQTYISIFVECSTYNQS